MNAYKRILAEEWKVFAPILKWLMIIICVELFLLAGLISVTGVKP